MQPPPVRKGPYLKTLKHVHTEQIARLAAKNQHECDLLEDIRNFTKQRSVIETTYAEALLKISSVYLNKKIPSIPDLRDEDDEEQWNVWNVWRTVLEENEKLARARLAAVDVFQKQIADDAKTIRQQKLQASKKCLDQLVVVQKEVQVSVSELDRSKKFYFEEEHMAHDARDKARDAEEKLKKKKQSIFSTFTSLQRSSVKVKSDKTKKEACEEKSTGARNDYILALAQANAHQDRYFNVDLDFCLRSLEGDVYDKLKEYLTLLGRTELLTCCATQNSFTKIKDQAQMLSRDYNVMCCVQYYPVLKQHIRYPFEACEGDHCKKITCDHGASSLLSREAKKWATKIGKEVKIIRENQRRLIILQQLKEAGHKSDPDDPNGPDLDIKIDEVKENIRRAETEKVKAEGCIDCLQDGGVNTDEWMQDVESLTTTLGIPRSGSSASVKTDASGEQPQQQEAFYDSDANDAVSEIVRENEVAPLSDAGDRDEDYDESELNAGFDASAQLEMERKRIEALAATWDDPTKVDWGDDSQGQEDSEPPLTSPPMDSNQGHRESWPADPGATEAGMVKCVALYTYTAQNPDELSIVENEHLDLIGEGDGDGWVRARNYKGEEGYVPQNYVEQEGNTSEGGHPLQPQISFSSVDYHIQDTNNATSASEQNEPNADDFPKEETETAEMVTENGITNGYPENGEYYDDQNLPAEEIPVAGPTTVSSGGTTPFINELRGEAETEGAFCRALYDYEATAPEELSFYEGQTIRVLRKVVHEEDDGWWEGEYDGMKGLFPSIVVEECRWDGEPFSPEGMDEEEEEEDEEEEVSDSGIQPPAYTPPEVPSHLLPPEKVIITQPTPEVEHPTTVKSKAGSSKTVVAKSGSSKSGGSKSGSSYSYDRPNFEIELSNDQQQKYQTQFGENGEPMIVVNEVPDVMITEPDMDHDTGDNDEDGAGDTGLEVAQIVITAATPMCEESKGFPEEDEEELDADMEDDIDNVPESEEQETEIEVMPGPVAVVPEPPEPVVEQEVAEEKSQFADNFADFSGFSKVEDSVDREEVQPPQAVQDSKPRVTELAFDESPEEEPIPSPQNFKSIEKSIKIVEKPARSTDHSMRSGQAPVKSVEFASKPVEPMGVVEELLRYVEQPLPSVEDLFPKMQVKTLESKQKRPPPAAAEPTKSQSAIEPKKASLEIDDKDKRSRISLGESNESPVTPEEMDLAKLETLKESDA